MDISTRRRITYHVLCVRATSCRRGVEGDVQGERQGHNPQQAPAGHTLHHTHDRHQPERAKVRTRWFTLIVRSLALVRPCLGLFPLVSTFVSSIYVLFHFYYYSHVCFTLAVHMREVSCVGFTLRAWEPLSLLSMLNYLYFGLLEQLCIN